jgi:radical SAM protein with 4Fe4S-binding SPASM domain
MKKCMSRIYGSEFSQEEIETAVRSGRLLSMEIEFSLKCNFQCIYCYVSNNVPYENELTQEEIRDVIDQAKELGARKIIILGGEPMLYPHCLEMIHYIKQQGLDIEMFTNGTHMTPSVAKELFDNGVRVVLKMNTFDEELQDILSGKKGAYQQIQGAFKNLLQAGYPSGCPMGVSTVICRQNIGELVGMWEWLRGQDIIPYFEMITPQGNARKNNSLTVDTEQMQELFYQIAEIDREKYGYHWNPQPPLIGEVCLRHQFSCTVNSRGYVQPCVGVNIPVGNIREKGLSDIIRDSEIMQDLKHYKQTLKGPCRECEQMDTCYGCRGAAYQMTGDYLASDPLCWKNLEKQDAIITLPADADRLVPHKPPMLMIDTLLAIRERASVSEMEVTDESIFLGADGTLEEASYAEIISQAIAAQNGFKNLENRKLRSEGLLLGIKKLEILGNARIGDKLTVHVYKVARYGEFGIIRGEVFRGADLIAKGEIKLWQSDTPPVQ